MSYLRHRIAEYLCYGGKSVPERVPHASTVNVWWSRQHPFPQRIFRAVLSSDLNSGPVSQGGHLIGIAFCRLGDWSPERAGFYLKSQAPSGDKNPGPWAPSVVPVQYSRRLPGTLQIKTIMLLLKYLLAWKISITWNSCIIDGISSLEGNKQEESL